MDEIKNYFISAGIEGGLLDKKIGQYEKHPDIAEEFKYWIKNGCYREDELCIEGYTASGLGKISEYLLGEASFSLMIMLRENPEKAKKKISKGFRIK